MTRFVAPGPDVAAHADLAGGGGVTLGRMTGTLLVAHEDVADLGGVHDRVVGGQDGATRNPEHDLDARVLGHAPGSVIQ